MPFPFPGSGMGLFSGLEGILGIGNMFASFLDHPAKQQAAEEVTQSQRDAISGQLGDADKAKREMMADAHRQRDRLLKDNKDTTDRMFDNLEGFGQWYEKNKMSDTARTETDDYWAKIQQGLSDSGLADAAAAGKLGLDRIPEMLAKWSGIQGDAQQTLANVRGDRTDLDRSYGQAYEDISKASSGEGIAKTQEHLREQTDYFGTYDTATAVGSITSQKESALRALDARQWEMDPMQYAVQRQQIEEQFAGQARLTANQISTQKQKEYREAEIALQQQDTTLKTSFNAAIAELNRGYGQAKSQMGFAETSALQKVMESVQGEADYFNSAVETASRAGGNFMAAIGDASDKILDTMMAAFGKDSAVTAKLMVDAPNAIEDSARAYTQQIESSYFGMKARAQELWANMRLAGHDFQFSFSPALALWGDTFNSAMGGIERAYGMFANKASIDMAGEQARRQSELGYAGLGLNAVNTFTGSGGIAGAFNLGGGGGGGGDVFAGGFQGNNMPWQT
jgi:hypothetical protein